MDRIDAVGRRRHLSPKTIECYQRWVGDFLRFHRDRPDWRHPRDLRAREVEIYLT